jgi:plastocyanin
MPMPAMHEPGPAHMTQFSSAVGIPVSAGDTLRLTATYDNTHPHVRAMGIMMVYLAPGPVFGCQTPPGLPPDPADAPSPPPSIMLPLLKKPTGKVSAARSTWVGDYVFGAQRVALRRGETYTWRFIGQVDHDVTLASGPVGIASPSLRGGARFSFRFTRRGTYNFFCSLHPTRMTQRIVVR